MNGGIAARHQTIYARRLMSEKKAAGQEYHVLVINCGSSSLKFALVEAASGARPFEGLAERLGCPEARLAVKKESGEKVEESLPGAGHREALERAVAMLDGIQRPEAVGHRVVHGGEKFTSAVVIDASVMEAIEDCVPLAPLHNPANLIGIRTAAEVFPGLPQVGVFDTAFHQTMPPEAYLYAIPYRLYENEKIRRYGFHGTSHAYVAGQAAQMLGIPHDEVRLVIAHLGNGCSACAVRGGCSVDTTMGLTPGEGLVMGTRSGDVDPGLHQFLQDRHGWRLAEISKMLHSESGLLGLSGISNDMRTLGKAAADGDPQATLAIDVFCYRLAKAMLGLCAALDRVDAFVFTGGIGENAAFVRSSAMQRLGILGVIEDTVRNAKHGCISGGLVSSEDSRIPCLVVSTNEEWMIARETARLACGTTM